MPGTTNAASAQGFLNLRKTNEEIAKRAAYLKRNNFGGVFVNPTRHKSSLGNSGWNSYIAYKEPLKEMYLALRSLYNDGRREGAQEKGYVFIITKNEAWSHLGFSNPFQPPQSLLKVFGTGGKIPVSVRLAWDKEDIWTLNRQVIYDEKIYQRNFIDKVLDFFGRMDGFELFGIGKEVLAAKDSIESLLTGMWRAAKPVLIYEKLHLQIKEGGKK